MNHHACAFTRRQFGAGLLGLPFARLAALEAAEFEAMPWNDPARIAKVYVASTALYWPKPTLDLDQEMKEVEANLAEVGKKHAQNVAFTGSALVRTAEDPKAWGGRVRDG